MHSVPKQACQPSMSAERAPMHLRQHQFPPAPRSVRFLSVLPDPDEAPESAPACEARMSGEELRSDSGGVDQERPAESHPSGRDQSQGLNADRLVIPGQDQRHNQSQHQDHSHAQTQKPLAVFPLVWSLGFLVLLSGIAIALAASFLSKVWIANHLAQ